MGTLNNLTAATVAGIAGAVAVNIAHELTRRLTDSAPRMDIVGMRAFARLAGAVGAAPPDNLRAATFVADVAANSVYYGLVGAAGPDRALAIGAALGAAAGIGGVLIPPPAGLGEEEVNRTRATQALVVLMYLGGGLAAGAAYRVLARRQAEAS
jgi:hypothetical protein